MDLAKTFDTFSKGITKITGSYYGFTAACLIVFAGDKVITVIGFILLIFIQQSQNKDTKAIQLKLDEIIRAIGTADDGYRRIENKTEKEIEKMNLNNIG